MRLTCSSLCSSNPRRKRNESRVASLRAKRKSCGSPATVLLPLTTDMLADVSAERNPTGFFLILPALCFAVLFWGMSIHWVFLLADGLTQKLWLRSKGYRKARKPAEPPSSTGDPNLALV